MRAGGGLRKANIYWRSISFQYLCVSWRVNIVHVESKRIETNRIRVQLNRLRVRVRVERNPRLTPWHTYFWGRSNRPQTTAGRPGSPRTRYNRSISVLISSYGGYKRVQQFITTVPVILGELLHILWSKAAAAVARIGSARLGWQFNPFSRRMGGWRSAGSSIINQPAFNRLSLNHLSTMAANTAKFLQLFVGYFR